MNGNIRIASNNAEKEKRMSAQSNKPLIHHLERPQSERQPMPRLSYF